MAECRDQINFPLPIIDPFDPNSLLNPNYQDDPNCPESAFHILIYLGDTAYDFTKHYLSKSMELEDNRGFERNKARFKIGDISPDGFDLPFLMTSDMRVEIWNWSMDDLFGSYRITDVEGKAVRVRCDGTEVTFYEVRCTDKTEDSERILVSERYQNVTTGFVFKDIVKRFTFFDDSAIDPTIGGTVTDLRFSEVYAGDALQRLIDLEPTFTSWYNPETNEMFFGEYADTLNTVVVAVEDQLSANYVYNLFNAATLSLTYDTSLVRNRIVFWYNRKYNDGTVSVTTGSNIVFGQNTEFESAIKTGAKFRIAGEDVEYTVSEILNDTSFTLSGPYQGIIQSGVLYEVSGVQSAIVLEDSASIQRMAILNNETGQYAGVYEYKVPDDQNAYTYEEAKKIVEAHLLRFSQPLIKGKANTTNSPANFPFANLRAGQVIRFELPILKKISADIVIQRMIRRDLGGIIYRNTDCTDGRVDPLMSIDFDFQDRIFDIRNQIKRLGYDVRKATLGDDSDIRTIKTFRESIFVQDCVQLVEPLSAISTLEISDSVSFENSIVFQEGLEISDAYVIKELTLEDNYTLPTPRKEAYVIGANNYGFVR